MSLFPPLPQPPPPWFFPLPFLLFIISLCSYVIIGLGKEFQGCRFSEQHCAELSSRVISNANTCPPGERELGLLVSAGRGSAFEIRLLAAKEAPGGQGT
jgi:hypothetical protein